MTETFVAGACKIDITPTDLSRVYLAGFGSNRKADRVLDPLYARALYLRSGKTEWVIVVLDLLGLMAPDSHVLRESAGEIDPENVWVMCTHTHSAPDTIGLWGPALLDGLPFALGIDRHYLSFIAGETGALIRRAKRLARPATIAFCVDTKSKSDLTWNIRDQSLMDHDLNCMVLRRSDGGSVIATVSNYGSHPESLWEHNTGVSPDYVASLHKAVERGMGGVSLFVNGVLGGMVTPGISEDSVLKTRLKFYQEYGSAIAEIIIKCAKKARKVSETRIDLREMKVHIPFRNDKIRFIRNLGFFDRDIDYRGVASSVAVAQIGPARFIGVPGEVLPKLGLEFKDMVGGRPTFLFGLCNDELGYLLPSEYFDDENYHYECSMSPGRDAASVLRGAYQKLMDPKP